MDTRTSDAGLVLAAQRGDKEAFAVVFGRHRPLLLALCRRALADPVLSEDAAQESALVAFLNLDRLQRADRFGPWLGGIGLNICRRMIRDRSRNGWSWEAALGGHQKPDLPDPEPGPEALAEAAELAERTRAAIAILPPGQRAAVVLFYLSDLTHAETADLLGIEVSAVKARLHKARRSLQRQFPDMEAEMDERLNRRTLTKTAVAISGSAALGQGAAASAGTDEVEVGEVTDAHGATALVEMRVADVRRKQAEHGMTSAHVVVLEEVAGTRTLPIWVGAPEGTAIAMHLEGVQMPRPLTIAFTASLLQAAGGQLREIHIDRLIDSTFYATAVVEGKDGISSIDARPSDAINLALLTGVPIRVAPAILESGPSSPEPAADETTVGPSEIVAEAMAGWHSAMPTSAE